MALEEGLRGVKRSSVSLSSDQDPIYAAKKQRVDINGTDQEFTTCLSSIVHDSQLLSPCSSDSFAFGDMVTGFDAEPSISVPEGGHHPILDTFLIDLPVTGADSPPAPTTKIDSFKEELTMTDTVRPLVTSPVSSTSPFPKVPTLTTSPSASVLPSKPLEMATSPVSSASLCPAEPVARKKDDNLGDATEMDQFHEKRMADRAARNRESSRRAREKAKQRFRAMEHQNRALQDMVQTFKMQAQHYKMQSEELFSELQRTRAVLQNCTICSYGAAAAQRATAVHGAVGPPPALAASHSVLRLDRCATEKCRPQTRLETAYRTSV